jgi:hypothetical protein
MTAKVMRFLCAVAGVRRDALLRAPDAMAQPAIFGLAILVTSSVAAITAAYAINRVFYGDKLSWLAAIVAGLLWGTLVFCIDRSMLNIDKSDPAWKVALLVSLRLAMATAVGIAISQPIYLRVARFPIDLGIHQAAREQLASETTQNAAQLGLPGKIQSYNSAEEESKSARVALDAGPSQSPDYADKVRVRDAARVRYQEVVERVRPILLQRQRQLAAIPESAQPASSLSEDVERMRIEIRDASQNLARANEELERAESAWRKQANDRLIAAQQDLVETRRAAAEANTSAERENAISRDAILSLNQPDLATEYTRSDQIIEDSKNPYSRSLARLAWMLHALFVLLESLIVTMKMLTPESGMDKAVKAVETEEQERLFIEANARISRQQMAVEATSDVYAKALAKWHVEQLEILKQGGPTTTPALLALRRECAQVVEAAA